MRITIPVSGDGDAWMSHMPEINFDPESMLDANGKIILSKVTDLLHQANKFHEEQFGRQMFMIGSGDGFNTYSMTVEFLRQLAAVTHWIENRPGSKAHVSSNESMQDRRLERRMSRDQVAFCRIDIRNVSTGVKFMIGIQNVSQIYDNYGEDRAKSIMSGFLTSISFRVNDKASKEYIKDLHGVNRKKEIYMASVQGRGIVEQLHDGHVVEDWDISRLGVGEAIIGFPGMPPFLFRFKRI